MTPACIPRELSEAVKRGRLVPFVGAGVSHAVLELNGRSPLFPTWTQLLERAAAYLDELGESAHSALVRALLGISQPDYYEAATRARAALAHNWYGFLKQQFFKRACEAEPSSLELARLIWALGSSLVITTNYDRVLQWAAVDPKDVAIWNVESPFEQLTYLRERQGPPTVWHLHGHIDNVSSLILTPEGYKLLYPASESIERRYAAALETLRSLLTTHQLLFVGLSLSDACLRQEVQRASEMFSETTGPHFVVLKRSSIVVLPRNVVPLYFDEYGEPLLDVLRSIAGVADGIENLSRFPGSEGATGARLRTTEPVDCDAPVFFVPYAAKSDRVIGRGRVLAALRQHMLKSSIAGLVHATAFQGLGGLGKTQLAVEYAHEFRRAYPGGVYWITADTPVEPQLLAIAEEVGWVSPLESHDIKLAEAFARLHSMESALLILDNVDSEDVIRGLLPRPEQAVHVLATSRRELPLFIPVPLDLLTSEESMELLKQEAGRVPDDAEDVAAAQQICQRLGGLPLALELAGAYLRHRRIAWGDYLRLLEAHLRTALPQRFLSGSFTRHEADLCSAVKLHEGICTEAPALAGIVDALTYVAPAPVHEGLLSGIVGGFSEADLMDASSLGVSLRILVRSSDPPGLQLHRLVRDVLLEQRPVGERREFLTDLCERLCVWTEAVRSDFGNVMILERALPHIEHLAASARSLGIDVLPRLLWLEAYPYYHRRDYPATLARLTDALESLTGNPDCEPSLRGCILCDLGASTSAMGDEKRGLELTEKANALFRSSGAGDTVNHLLALENLASAYASVGRGREALEVAGEALATAKRIRPDDPFHLARAYRSLAEANRTLRRYGEAVKASEAAVSFLSRRYPGGHTELLDLHLQQAALHLGQHEFQSALECSQRSRELSCHLFGPDHFYSIRSSLAEGVCQAKLGHSAAAGALLGDAYRRAVSVLGFGLRVTVECTEAFARHLAASERVAEGHSLLVSCLRRLGQTSPHVTYMRKAVKEYVSDFPRKGFRAPSRKASERRRR